MSKKNKKLSLIKVKNSKIHGRGVYACENIKKRVKIIEFTGEKILSKEGDIRSLKNPEISYVVILNDDYDIDGGVNGNDSKLINHSCSPNAIFRVIRDHIWIIAIKNIKKGDEITFDYDMDALKLEKCFCNTKKCRGYMNPLEDIRMFKKKLKS